MECDDVHTNGVFGNCTHLLFLFSYIICVCTYVHDGLLTGNTQQLISLSSSCTITCHTLKHTTIINPQVSDGDSGEGAGGGDGDLIRRLD